MKPCSETQGNQTVQFWTLWLDQCHVCSRINLPTCLTKDFTTHKTAAFYPLQAEISYTTDQRQWNIESRSQKVCSSDRSICWICMGRGGYVLDWWGVFETTTIWRARLCYNTGHFPVGYLAMGKNVFSQINDMFIQKEVTTLFRSSAASKFERKNESKPERGTERECSFSLILDNSSNRMGLIYRLVHMFSRIDVTRLWKLASNGTWSPNSCSLCDPVSPPSVQTIRI